MMVGYGVYFVGRFVVVDFGIGLVLLEDDD